MDFHFSYPNSKEFNTIEINDKIFVKIELFEKSGNFYYIAKLTIDGKTKILGKYDKQFTDVKAQYKNGKIMLYHSQIINGIEEIIKVLSLYELIEESFYSCTEEEALKEFDYNLDIKHLKDKHNIIYSENYNNTKVKKLK